MNIYILTPNKETLFNKTRIKQLESISNAKIIFITTIQPLESLETIFNDNSEKVIAIDPDYCNWKISNTFLDKVSNVKAICLQTTSFQWAEPEYAKQKDIPILNIVGFSTEAVAEWALMMMLNLARKVPLIIQNNWKCEYSTHKGIELKNKKVGIIGLGKIGTRIAELCKGIGMEVFYWSKNSRNPKFKYNELNKLMVECDVVFPTYARNEETIKLINDKMINSMKRSAMIISVLWTRTFNEELVIKKVKNSELYGYAFHSDTKTIKSMNGNLWTGISMDWCTQESFSNNSKMWIENIVNATKGIFKTKIN